MAFSIRSFFGKEKSPDGTGPSGGAFSLPTPQGPAPVHGLPPGPGSSPFAGSPLFRATSGPAQPAGQGQPVASPFSPFSVAPGGGGGLTVEDILPLLPREVAKDPQLPPGQPLQISDE